MIKTNIFFVGRSIFRLRNESLILKVTLGADARGHRNGSARKNG